MAENTRIKEIMAFYTLVKKVDEVVKEKIREHIFVLVLKNILNH
jgi:hypothetical protein